MPDEQQIATLRVELSSPQHSMSDVALVVEDLDSLVTGSLWGAVLRPERDSETLMRARAILEKSASGSKAGSRFHPDFRKWPYEEPYDGFDPFDPLDAGLQFGMNSWFRRAIFQTNPGLYNELCSFAEVRRLEHHSPLIIELGIVVSLLSTPVVLAWGLMTAAARARRMEAEADIREAEAESKREEAKQRRLQTRMMEAVTEAVEKQAAAGKLEVPKEAITKAVQVASPGVADLGENSLIKEVTFGISTGNGKK
ncbi:MAG: hypothetical protein ABR555_05240 [Pyrinomonadaceae bacterium]